MYVRTWLSFESFSCPVARTFISVLNTCHSSLNSAGFRILWPDKSDHRGSLLFFVSGRPVSEVSQLIESCGAISCVRRWWRQTVCGPLPQIHMANRARRCCHFQSSGKLQNLRGTLLSSCGRQKEPGGGTSEGRFLSFMPVIFVGAAKVAFEKTVISFHFLTFLVF